MIVTCAGRQLKQPIEFEIPDKTYDEITKLASENQQNYRIHELAMSHVKKYGYDIGRCTDRLRNVDFNACISCGIKRGQNKTEWLKCKKDNLEYKYPKSRTTAQAVKKIDEKIAKKIAPTKEEIEAEKNLFLTDGGKK